MRLTSLQICQLIGRGYPWYDTRRRVARERLAGAGGMAAAQAYLPLSHYEPGAPYGAADAVRMAVAAAAEQMGCTFEAGARLAVQADVAQILTYDGRSNLYAVSCQTADGTWHYWCGPQPGADVAPAGAIVINLSALLSHLRKRAAMIGVLWESGSNAAPAPRLRPQLRNATRPPRATL